jgi:outer membrane lipoprotein SlyB
MRTLLVAGTLGTLLAGCSNSDFGGLLGSNDSNNGRSERIQAANNARDACADEVRDRGWTVVDQGNTDPSGQNNVEVELQVRQDDGDVRNMTCTYDTGRGDARLSS